MTQYLRSDILCTQLGHCENKGFSVVINVVKKRVLQASLSFVSDSVPFRILIGANRVNLRRISTRQNNSRIISYQNVIRCEKLDIPTFSQQNLS